MSDSNTIRPGSVDAMSTALEAVAVATLMSAMNGPDKKLGVDAAGMVLRALGKDAKAKETASTSNVLTINMLGTLKESMKGIASMAQLIKDKEGADDAESS